MSKEDLKRAISMTELAHKKYRLLAFRGKWHDAFGEPESYGIWFIWGASGSGKSRFVAQLCRELSRLGRVVYNSLEEASSLTIQQSFLDAGLLEAGRRVILVSESMEQLSDRLREKKGPSFAVIDSFQYARMSYPQYIEFKERHRNKLVIFISHADGKLPAGRSAKGVMYDAALKIWVEGFKAFSKGRYVGPGGGQYTIWEEGSKRYWIHEN